MPENQKQELGELLAELMNARGVNLDRLAYATGVPKRFLSALVSGEYDKLPSPPYVRGYLIKIAESLDFNPDALLQSYRDTVYKIKSSGREDLMPKNRFADYSNKKNLILVILLAALVLGYLAFRVNEVLGVPELTITSPTIETVTTKEIIISGRVTPGDKLTLNNEVIYTDEEGGFSKEISLDPGVNTLEFVVTRFLGKENKVTRQIFYQPDNA